MQIARRMLPDKAGCLAQKERDFMPGAAQHLEQHGAPAKISHYQ